MFPNEVVHASTKTLLIATDESAWKKRQSILSSYLFMNLTGLYSYSDLSLQSKENGDWTTANVPKIKAPHLNEFTD